MRKNELRTRDCLISIVVPCYNESLALRRTHRALLDVLDASVRNYEIIYVDDGSTDTTSDVIDEVAVDTSYVKKVSLSRNFGHQAAITAGMEEANGRALIFIDADLQDPPRLIPKMIDMWINGADIVHGVRSERMGESLFKRITASLYYRILAKMSDTAVVLDSGDFRLVDRAIIDIVNNMEERDRYLRGIFSWVGFTQAELKYTRDARVDGESKYPFRKMLALALDGIIGFSIKPIRAATVLGFVVWLLSLVGFAYAALLRIFSETWVTGWTLLFMSIMFFGGAQMLFLGLLGEYIGKIYSEVKKRPRYLKK
jgi:glycosyltransferase involved in cell wall biosynthesis